jgi:hypothetical protein
MARHAIGADPPFQGRSHPRFGVGAGTVVGKWLDLEITHHVIDPLLLLEFAATSFMFGALIGYAVPECIRVDEPSLTERTAIGPSDTTLLRTRPLDV